MNIIQQFINACRNARRERIRAANQRDRERFHRRFEAEHGRPWTPSDNLCESFDIERGEYV